MTDPTTTPKLRRDSSGNWDEASLLDARYILLGAYGKTISNWQLHKAAKTFDIPSEGVTAFRVAPDARWCIYASPGFKPGDGFKSTPLIP